jgi:acetoin:2,6-dichlorophenolindophenol oxidoreductase subunit alpha
MTKKYSKKFLVSLFRMMLRIRLCEESLVGPILKGQVRCPVHLYSGQEAVAAGVGAALKPSDYVFGNHRSHGHFLAHGGSLKELIAEIFGKDSGCSRGRGGSMHLCKPHARMLGSAPIVAGTISLALGAALASKIKKENSVTVSFFGDGATGEGVLYESLNFAALKDLPIIFACENNFYSTHMPILECRPNKEIYKIALPYGIKTFRCYGNSVLEVYETAKNAVQSCRQGKGPVFLEFLTYRFRGHVGPDDNVQGQHTDIRTKEEIDSWKKKDPVALFTKYLLNNEIINPDVLKDINDEEESGIVKAYRFMANSSYPGKQELGKYVFK